MPRRVSSRRLLFGSQLANTRPLCTCSCMDAACIVMRKLKGYPSKKGKSQNEEQPAEEGGVTRKTTKPWSIAEQVVEEEQEDGEPRAKTKKVSEEVVVDEGAAMPKSKQPKPVSEKVVDEGDAEEPRTKTQKVSDVVTDEGYAAPPDEMAYGSKKQRPSASDEEVW